MNNVIEPTKTQLDNLVKPYLEVQSSGLGFAIGYASPNFPNHGSIYFAGSVQNQFGAPLALNRDTLFEIASGLALPGFCSKTLPHRRQMKEESQRDLAGAYTVQPCQITPAARMIPLTPTIQDRSGWSTKKLISIIKTHMIPAPLMLHGSGGDTRLDNAVWDMP